MKKFLIRLGVNAVALWAAVMLLKDTYLFPQTDRWTDFLLLALVFGVVNAIIRPVAMALGCPVIILTLGLGTLLINAGMFALAGWIGTQWQFGFTVNGFWGALLGSLIVSVVSFILGLVFKDARKRD